MKEFISLVMPMQDLFTFKNTIHQRCINLVEEKMAETQRQIDELREGAGDSGKSSAGDKHETGRAMADLEVEKHHASLKNLLQMQALLKQTDPQQKRERVITGTLVETDLGTFYITVALGKIKVDEREVLVISADAPIVKALQKYPTINPVIFSGKVIMITDIA